MHMKTLQEYPKQGSHERGFKFRVPMSRRHDVLNWIKFKAEEVGFILESAGPLGGFRCSYRERNAEGVLKFVMDELRDMKVSLIPNYQKRYGVYED